MVLPRPVLIVFLVVLTASVLGAPVYEGGFSFVAARSLSGSHFSPRQTDNKGFPKLSLGGEEIKGLAPTVCAKIEYIEKYMDHINSWDQWDVKAATALLRNHNEKEGRRKLDAVVKKVQESTGTQFVASEEDRKHLFIEENIQSLTDDMQNIYSRHWENAENDRQRSELLDMYVPIVAKASRKRYRDFHPDEQLHAASSSHPTARAVDGDGDISSEAPGGGAGRGR